MSESISIEPGRKYRFEASSAEEAVLRIRSQMGPRARVVSVKQKNGRGLSRLINSPRFEIIAMIDPEDAAPGDKEGQEQPPEPEPERETPVRPTATGKSALNRTYAEAAHASNQREEEGEYEEQQQESSATAPHRLETILQKSGIDQHLLEMLKSSPVWSRIQERPVAQAIGDFGSWLKARFREVPTPAASDRVVFFGLSGSGKTSALCKILTEKVFYQQEHPRVAKLDAETLNPDDALRVYCDVLNVEFLPHISDEADGDGLRARTQSLYIDTPGLPARQPAEWSHLGKRLDDLEVDTRVLVLNATCETELLKRQTLMAQRAGATHCVLTHLDEVAQPLRLWPILLGADLGLWFVSEGPDLASEYDEHGCDALLRETFPAYLI